MNLLDQSNLILFSEQHEAHFRSAFEIYKDNKLTGIGVNQFRNKCSEFKYNFGEELTCSTHPHNTYLQLLAELGLLGSILIILIFLACLVRFQFLLLKDKKSSDSKIIIYETFLIISILISLWPLFPTLNFFNNYINVIYFLPIGFYLAIIKK